MDSEQTHDPICVGLTLPKPLAVAEIQQRLERDYNISVDGTDAVLRAALRLYGPTFNPGMRALTGGGEEHIELVHPASSSDVRTPRFLNGRPDMFPPMESDKPWPIPRPDYNVLHARDATLRLIPDAPTVFDRHGRVLDGYSTSYWRLAHFYEGAEALLQCEPRPLDRPALVLMDDIWDINYCHWIADWLPRVSLLGANVEDFYVLTSPIAAAFQIETLVACGLRRECILPMTAWDAVSAPELIVQQHISDVIHPAYRAAPWATTYLRDKLLTDASVADAPAIDRLYISRADAPGRSVVNEMALVSLLGRYGYQAVTLSGRKVAEQARLFNQASFVMAMHGAGLTNIVFGGDDTALVEIFAPTYGTLSFWALAGWRGAPYFVYVADHVRAASRTQLDDVEIDLDKFETRVLQPLHGRPLS